MWLRVYPGSSQKDCGSNTPIPFPALPRRECWQIKAEDLLSETLSMIDNPSEERKKLKESKQLLADTPAILNSCGLDLLVFLHRHPRALLTNEQLAAFVGCDVKQVAKAIDGFIGAGILLRTQNPKHASRMYSLVLDGENGDGLKAVLKLASTRIGRNNFLEVLNSGQSRTERRSLQVRQQPNVD